MSFSYSVSQKLAIFLSVYKANLSRHSQLSKNCCCLPAYSPLRCAASRQRLLLRLALQHWHTKYTMSILVKVFIWHVCLHQLACAHEMHSAAWNICNLYAHLTFALTYSPIHGLQKPNESFFQIFQMILGYFWYYYLTLRFFFKFVSQENCSNSYPPTK